MSNLKVSVCGEEHDMCGAVLNLAIAEEHQVVCTVDHRTGHDLRVPQSTRRKVVLLPRLWKICEANGRSQLHVRPKLEYLSWCSRNGSEISGGLTLQTRH